MPLLLTFAVLAAAFSLLLFLVSLAVQAYLYEQPAAKLPLRAIAGGVFAAAFLTFWIHTNARADSKDKYGTLFEFNSTASKSFDEFTAIRRHPVKSGSARETSAKFTKVQDAYLQDKDPLKPFKLTTSDYFVTALELPEGDAVARFDAELFVADESKPGEFKPWRPGDAGEPKYSREAVRIFREANGRRYIEFTQAGSPGTIQIPSRGAWIGALALNLLHFAVWLVVFWPILRFGSGAAFGLALAMTLTVMLCAMPILFERHQARPAAAAA